MLLRLFDRACRWYRAYDPSHQPIVGAHGASRAIERRKRKHFADQCERLHARIDRLFAILLFVQWVGISIATVFVAPQGVDTWTDAWQHRVVEAVSVGGLIILLPLIMTVVRPGWSITRYCVALGQALTSALLFHLTGGRIETHFHVFGSLALLSCYRDWRVVVTASIVVIASQFARGFWNPQLVAQGLGAIAVRASEYAGWVTMLDALLIVLSRQGLAEMRKSAERQASLECANETIDAEVVERTVQLHASEARTGAMLEAALDCVITFDDRGRIVEFNPAAEQAFGYSRPEIVGERIPNLIVEAGLDGTSDRLSQDFKRLGERFESEATRRDGSRFPVELAIVPIREQSQPMFTAYLRDITERKRTEEALRQNALQLQQKQKLEAVGELAGGIAHEFNNLLQAIRGYTKYAMDTLSPEQQSYQDLEQVVKAADRAATLTRQLLTFSRRKGIERQNVDHVAVVTDLVKMLRPLIGEQIELLVKLNPGAGQVFADPGILEQMLLNLCVNARDTMPQGGKLTISSDHFEQRSDEHTLHPDMKPGHYLLLTVTDTGTGMSPEVRQRIFEPFYTTKEVGKGTGLGLAMVYGVVQQHEGVIEVDSQLGAGTAFRVYLPIVDGTHTITAESSSETIRGGTELILIAEDEPMVRHLAVRILEDAGYATISAEDGAQAVHRFEQHADEIDLVLLDAMMPKLSGREVYQKVMEIKPQTVVIGCSGYATQDGPAGFIAERGLRLVEKPFERAALLLAVREALDQQKDAEVSTCTV